MSLKTIKFGTNWPLILVLLGAGIVCAFQIGKAPPALAWIREELELDLFFAGWLISIYAFVASIIGIFGGFFSDVAGYRRALVFGLISIAVGSILGAFASNGKLLLFARLIEAVGYLPIVVSVPAILGWVASSEGDRRIALGIWGAYMPAGTSIMMLSAPIFLEYAGLGWRGLWLANGIIAGIFAIVVIFTTRGIKKPSGFPRVNRANIKDVLDFFKNPRPVLLGLFFGTYTGNYLTVYGFLPTMLVDELGVSRSNSAYLVAFAVMVNILGNIFGGWLRKKDIALINILIGGSIFTGVVSVWIFSNFLSLEIRYGMAVLYSAVCGLIPGALWSAVTTFAPRHELVGMTVGWVVQGGNIGTLILPPITALIIAWASDWQAAGWVVAISSFVGVIIILIMDRISRKQK